MSRLTDPVYRRRALQFGADAVLAAAAFALAFKLRFLDVSGGIPERYETMLAGSIVFVALGQALVFELFGQHQKWWRYFRLPDLWPLVRTAAIATGLLVLVFAVAKPYPDDLPRSVAMFDFLLLTTFFGGARLLRRSIAERPERAAARRKARTALVVGAGSGGQMVVRELQLNPKLGTRAIGFVDDDPAKRGMRNLGLKVLGTTAEIGTVLDRTKPDEVIIAIPSAPGILRAQGGGRVSRARHPDSHAADRVRAAAGRRAAHPPAARGAGRGRARSRAGGDGARPGRRLPRGQGRARHRGRRLDRLRAVPPDLPYASAAAGDARPRRERAVRDRPRDDRAMALRPRRVACSPTARRATGCSR